MCLAATPLRTVHHSPPKKNIPSNIPASSAGASSSGSVMFVSLRVDFFVFLVYPMPGVETAQPQTDGEQRERPRMFAGVMLVDPDAQRRAEQRGDRHRPAHQPHHP